MPAISSTLCPKCSFMQPFHDWILSQGSVGLWSEFPFSWVVTVALPGVSACTPSAMLMCQLHQTVLAYNHFIQRGNHCQMNVPGGELHTRVCHKWNFLFLCGARLVDVGSMDVYDTYMIIDNKYIDL